MLIFILFNCFTICISKPTAMIVVCYMYLCDTLFYNIMDPFSVNVFLCELL